MNPHRSQRYRRLAAALLLAALVLLAGRGRRERRE